MEPTQEDSNYVRGPVVSYTSLNDGGHFAFMDGWEKGEDVDKTSRFIGVVIHKKEVEESDCKKFAAMIEHLWDVGAIQSKMLCPVIAMKMGPLPNVPDRWLLCFYGYGEWPITGINNLLRGKVCYEEGQLPGVVWE